MTRPTIHQGETDAAPGEVGFLPAKIERLDALYLDLIPDRLQAAGYLLARGGKVFAHRTMGRLKHDDEAALFAPDSIRCVASITKTFVAIAILQLVEEGRLYLAQPLATVIDEFDTDMHRDIHLIHLLTHTSGIAADPGFFCEPYPREWWLSIGTGETSWIEAILSGPTRSRPGEEFAYSSAGFCVLGEVITRAAGVNVEEYILENVIRPLGLARTFFDVPPELHGQVCTVNEPEEEWLAVSEERDASRWPPRTAGGIYSSWSPWSPTPKAGSPRRCSARGPSPGRAWSEPTEMTTETRMTRRDFGLRIRRNLQSPIRNFFSVLSVSPWSAFLRLSIKETDR